MSREEHLENLVTRLGYLHNFNLHLEAITKHFSRCGEVLKVIILTDATTSQSKGSAYIEFSSRETAEIALTLNETSFMSRMMLVLFIYMGFQSKFEAPF